MDGLIILLVITALISGPIMGAVALLRTAKASRRLDAATGRLNAIATTHTDMHRKLDRLATRLDRLEKMEEPPEAPREATETESAPQEPAAAAAPEPPAAPEPSGETTVPPAKAADGVAGHGFVFSDEQLAQYGQKHLTLLDKQLGIDKANLSGEAQARHQRALAAIVSRIHKRTGMPEDPAGADAEAFLHAFAEALRAHIAQRSRAAVLSVTAALPEATQATATGDAEPAGRNLEATLASQWMVWLGGLTVALSAVFLFTYAVEQGWLVPPARVALGILLGLALVSGGEWLRRHPLERLKQAVDPDYVPPALTGAGVFALFVSLYAGYGLFSLYGATLAFGGLAAVSFAALVLALRQGWFVALLGLVGGYVIPLLIESGTPEAMPVFLFLFVLTAACLSLIVYRDWWWLSFGTLAGGLGWPLLWLAGPWVLADQGVIGGYAIALSALFAMFSVRLPVRAATGATTAWLMGVASDTSGLGFILSGMLLIALAVACDFNEASFILLGAYAVVGLGFGIRRAAFEGLAVVSALIVAIAFFIWPAPAEIVVPPEISEMGFESDVTYFKPYLFPAEFKAFARGLLGFALLFGLGGFAALRRATTPAVWSTISVAMPLYLLVLGYWQIGGFEVDIAWSALGWGLAILFLGAAALVPRLLLQDTSNLPLATYAAGCTAALALAFTCILREAWLTVALSMEVLALSLIWARLRVNELAMIAQAVLAVVAARLLLNVRIVEYEGSVVGVFSWVTYGYGLPAIALALASRPFRAGGRIRTAQLCEALATGLAFLMVALQLRVWTSGAIDAGRYALFDQAIQSIWWLAAGGLLLRKELETEAPWAKVGGWVLVGIACLQVLLGHVIAQNPLLTNDPVGAYPLANVLSLAYAAPAVICWVLARDDAMLIEPRFRHWLRGLSVFLVLVQISLEVRRFFWGTEIGISLERVTGNAELYAYSASWLAYALVLLALGIARGSSFWRYTSLAVLILTVLKVFLFDMSDLTGLFRVASFLGLGLTLIGIGHVYRRFVLRD